MRGLRFFCALMLLALLVPVGTQAQTAGTATVHGTVTDPTGAVIPQATVELTDVATNMRRSMETNKAGQYLFPSVPPGTCTLTVTMQGFNTYTMSDLKVEVAKSYNVNVTLQVGAMAVTVEVTSGAVVELQTTDARVGTVIGGEQLLRLPVVNRSAAALLLLQPLVAPGRGEGYHSYGGQVSGARSDQSVFSIDGGDATSDTDGTGAYNAELGSGIPSAGIDTPSESIEEFRVSTAVHTADFGRSPGGKISFVTKRGTNDLHGSAYWYHQNDNLNANRWTFNRTGIAKPEEKNNRFGFSLGGPLFRDKLYLYGHYEAYRFHRQTSITRLVPRDTLRQGILRIDDGGTIVEYDLATSTACGPAGTTACDPRGVGISPVVSALWAMLPAGNDPFLGDGLNTIGFRAPTDSSKTTDFVVGRLDYNISDTWNFFGSYRYSRRIMPDPAQVDISSGQAVTAADKPSQPRYVVWGVTGQISPRLTNAFRFSYLRHWWAWYRSPINPQVPGTVAALQLGGEPGVVDEPINIDSQNARTRVWRGKTLMIGDDVTWITGRHTIQFGGNYRRHDFFHQRDDKVTGALTSLIYWLDANTGVSLSDANRPPSGDLEDWDNLYAAALGLVDRAGFIQVSDGNFDTLPRGTALLTNVDVDAFEFYAQDTWRPTPSLTLTYGLNWQVQMPPVEEDGLQTITVYRDTEAPLVLDQYINRRREAALLGQIFNPELAWSTLGRTGRKYMYDPDYDNFGPRFSAAWNPSFTKGFLGRLFGEGKTVLRGGYSLSYDRLTGVNLVMGAPINVGFGRIMGCTGPTISAPGVFDTCAGASNPSTGFRIGVDGDTVPITPIPMTDPVVVSTSTPAWYATQYDIDFELGEHHLLDFTIQRELPGDMIMEVGWVGRLGRNLQARVDLQSMPLMFTDPTSGQTLAEAFDALAAELRAGVSTSAVTPQAWFENLLGGGSTVTLAGMRRTEIMRGELSEVGRDGINRIGLGGIGIDGAFDNMQVEYRHRVIADGYRSNYHGGFISLRKRMSHGLTFALNYTLAKAMDPYGWNQQSSSPAASAFDPDFHYGPALWDRRHTFNSYWLYELPFGRGRRFAPESNVLAKIVGGWYFSGIFTASSGIAQCVRHERGVFGGGPGADRSCALPVGPLNLDVGVHEGVTRGAADVNMFADPDAAWASFRHIRVSEDGRHGRGAFYGLPRWWLGTSLGKKTQVTETVNIVFTADFLNMLNHMEYDDPGQGTGSSSLRLRSKSLFGRLTSQFGSPRRIQFGLRIEF